MNGRILALFTKIKVELIIIGIIMRILRLKSIKLPPLLPCFQLAQPYSEVSLISPNVSDDVAIESMTIAEYKLYVAKKGLRKNQPNGHSYSVTSNFYNQSPCKPNPQPKDDALSFDELFNDLFKMKAKNLRRMQQEEDLEEECNEGNMEEIWDITIEDVEMLRQILTCSTSEK
ncbi:hypothetical protein Tco_1025080 [Tanacetum coccineum]